MKLMYDNLVVATSIKKKNEMVLVLEKNIPDFFIPSELFLGESEVSFYDVVDWASERIFPRNRLDVEKQLKLLELEDYLPLPIIRKTKACLMEDGFWLSFSDEDDWRVDTTRGRAGHPEWDSETFKIKKGDDNEL